MYGRQRCGLAWQVSLQEDIRHARLGKDRRGARQKGTVSSPAPKASRMFARCDHGLGHEHMAPELAAIPKPVTEPSADLAEFIRCLNLQLLLCFFSRNVL